MEIKMRSLDGINLNGKKVLLRPDINSPIDPQTGAIVSDDRIVKTIPVIRELIDGGAAVAIIAHQGNTLDYQNLTDLSAHAARIEELLGRFTFVIFAIILLIYNAVIFYIFLVDVMSSPALMRSG